MAGLLMAGGAEPLWRIHRGLGRRRSFWKAHPFGAGAGWLKRARIEETADLGLGLEGRLAWHPPTPSSAANASELERGSVTVPEVGPGRLGRIRLWVRMPRRAETRGGLLGGEVAGFSRPAPLASPGARVSFVQSRIETFSERSRLYVPVGLGLSPAHPRSTLFGPLWGTFTPWALLGAAGIPLFGRAPSRPLPTLSLIHI